MKNNLSFLGLGTWCFGDEENPSVSDPMKSYWGGQKRSDSIKTLHAALRAGINHFDTAQVYGNGRSEQIVGQELRRFREKVIIADKFMPYEGNQEYIIRKTELSLKRLNSDYIDIMYIHWPVPGVENACVTEAMEKLREQGKIRYIGVSNFSCSQLEDALRGGQVDFCQVGYNFLWRRCEKDILPFCREKGISTVAYSFFAQGFLTGSRFGAEDHRRKLVFCRDEKYARAAAGLRNLAEENGISVPALLFAWGRRTGLLDSVLVGCRNRKSLEDNVAALSVQVPDDIVEKAALISEKICFPENESDNIFDHRV